jgi:hypothetical protein
MKTPPDAYPKLMKQTVLLLTEYQAKAPGDPLLPLLTSMLGLIQLQGNILGENLGTITNAVSTLVAERNDIHGVQ